ncbi:MAG: hypothetical protein ACO3RB_07785 [Ilumatobacteraceae bacterium]
MGDGLRRGTIVEFDEIAGLGAVVDDEGARWPFHCVSIADGSRRIDVGQKTAFSLGFCTLRREAVRLEKLPA